MKRKGNIFACMLLLLCISMLAAMTALAYDEGEYQIEVSDIRVSGRNLKRGDRCRISMKINNKGFKKLDNVEILYRSPSTQFYAVPLKYKKSSGRWVGNFKAKDGMQKGLWKIWSIRVDYSDGYEGGGYSYYNRRGFANLSGSGGDLSKGNIRVRGTKGDYSKPEIQWDTLSVSKSSVTEKSGKITYRLKVTDKSGVRRVAIELAESHTGERPLVIDSEMEMKYNKKTGCYELTVRRPKGTYFMNRIYVEDVFGNSATYFNKEFDHGKYDCGLIDLSQFRVDL